MMKLWSYAATYWPQIKTAQGKKKYIEKRERRLKVALHLHNSLNDYKHNRHTEVIIDLVGKVETEKALLFKKRKKRTLVPQLTVII